MRYNIYYQSYTLCELQAGLTDFMTIVKDEERDVLSIAQYFAQVIFDNLNERIACVVCDEDDIVIHYFQATHQGVIGPANAERYFAGGKAMLENGRFYIERS